VRSRRLSASSQLSCPARPNKKFRGDTCVPSMHRKHSSDGRRSRMHGRNSGGGIGKFRKVFRASSLGLFQKEKEK
jgi:hypothetical protein